MFAFLPDLRDEVAVEYAMLFLQALAGGGQVLERLQCPVTPGLAFARCQIDLYAFPHNIGNASFFKPWAWERDNPRLSFIRGSLLSVVLPG